MSWLCLFDILHYLIAISTSVVRKDIGMRLALLSFFLIMSLSAAAQRQISYIDNAGSWIHVWDKTGKRNLFVTFFFILLVYSEIIRIFAK